MHLFSRLSVLQETDAKVGLQKSIWIRLSLRPALHKKAFRIDLWETVFIASWKHIMLSRPRLRVSCLTELTPSWNNQQRKLQFLGCIFQGPGRKSFKVLCGKTSKSTRLFRMWTYIRQSFLPRTPRRTLTLFLPTDTCNTSISVADPYSPSLINTIGKSSLMVCFPSLLSLSGIHFLKNNLL